MRSFPIVNIEPSVSPSIPASFEISFDHSESFHGKEWVRYPVGGGSVRAPFYAYDLDPTTGTPAPPVVLGVPTGLLLATTFDVIDNPKYAGRYTVYTPLTGTDLSPVELTVTGNTLIRVAESIPSGTGSELSTGTITNISTFVINEYGGAPIVVLEQQIDTARPISFTGHRTSGWGEIMLQNMVKQLQNFAGLSAPANPFIGQLWFNTGTNLLMVRQIDGWAVVNSSYSAPASYYHTQTTAAGTWNISHNLAIADPSHTCSVDCFVDMGGGVFKNVLPQDVTYIDANTMTVTFSMAFSGRATVRP